MTQDTSPPSPDATLAKRLARRRALRAVLLSVVIFGAGGLTGWGAAHLMHQPGRAGGGDALRPDPPVQEIVQRMQEELLLSADQSRQIGDIYATRFAALKAIRQTMGPKLKQEYDTLRTDVQKVLTPAQFAKWDQRFEQVRSRMLPPDRAGGPPPRAGALGPPKGPLGPGLPGTPQGPWRPGDIAPNGADPTAPAGAPPRPNGAPPGPPGAPE